MKKAKKAAQRECVRVCVRCRPLSPDEVNDGRNIAVKISNETGEILIQNPKEHDSTPPKQYTFDKAYDWNTKQKTIYEESAFYIIDSVLDGFNGTIFAYGQTGTGKTFTMEGKLKYPELMGIIPRAFRHVFQHIESTPNMNFLVRASMLELYNEQVRDLLSKNHMVQLQLRERKDSGVFVKGLSTYIIEDEDELLTRLNSGKKNRKTGSTKMNAESSRSHCIFVITVEMSELGPDGQQRIRVGKLNLVDLAGSERQSKTHAQGDRLIEAININLSLTTLGNVISSLVDGKSHIPYRDSKLTRMLQDSLGGNTKTVMIANIGPADYNYDETLSTLRYANRAKRIQNNPHRNEDPKDAMIRQFQEEIMKLREQLSGIGTDGAIFRQGGQPRQMTLNDQVVKIKNSKQIKRLQEKWDQEKMQQKEKHSNDLRKIKDLTNISNTEKQQLISELKEKEAEEKAENERKQILAQKYQKMQQKLLVGSKKIEKAIKEREELEQLRIKNVELEYKKKQAQKEREQKEEDILTKKMEFKDMEEEVKHKKILVQKLKEKIIQMEDSIQEREEEINQERDRNHDIIQQYYLKLNLQKFIIDHFIPTSELEQIEESAQWSDEIDNWIIPNLHLSGLHQQTQQNKVQEEEDEALPTQQNVYFMYTDQGPVRQDFQDPKEQKQRLKQAKKQIKKEKQKARKDKNEELKDKVKKSFPKSKGLVKR